VTNHQQTLSLIQARRIVERSLAAAKGMNVSCSVAIIDATGHLLSFAREDAAILGSVELSINKAYTAQAFNRRTDELATLAQPGAELFGIQHSHFGRVVIFGGGIPVRIQGQVIGAIGVSGGTVAEDIAIAEAGLASFLAEKNRTPED
jgi:uncharacterized protein GlcG (DUF336 family)